MTKEHWVQWLAIVVAVTLASIPGIWFLSQDIEGVRNTSAAATATLSAKQAADEARLDAIQKVEAEHHSDDVLARQQISTQLTAVIQGLASVQVDIAKLGTETQRSAPRR